MRQNIILEAMLVVVLLFKLSQKEITQRAGI
jgi:hypothetical protein